MIPDRLFPCKLVLGQVTYGASRSIPMWATTCPGVQQHCQDRSGPKLKSRTDHWESLRLVLTSCTIPGDGEDKHGRREKVKIP
jgi:hypothetical protein